MSNIDPDYLAQGNGTILQMSDRTNVWISGNDAPSCIEDILSIGYTIKKYKNNAKKN